MRTWGPLAFGFSVADDLYWETISRKGHRYIDIISAQLVTPPEKDVTVLKLVVGPFALSVGLL